MILEVLWAIFWGLGSIDFGKVPELKNKDHRILLLEMLKVKKQGLTHISTFIFLQWELCFFQPNKS